MKKLFRKIAALPFGYLLAAVLLIISGTLLLALPETSLANAFRVVGGAILVIFIIRIVLILGERERSVRFFFRMAGTVLALIAGGALLITPNGVFAYLLAIFGLLLILDGAFKLQTAILSHRYKYSATWVMLGFAVVTIGFGFVLVRMKGIDEKTGALLLAFGFFSCALQNLMSLFLLPMLDKRRREEAQRELEELNREKDEGELRECDARTRKAKERKLARAERKAEKARKKAEREARNAERAAKEVLKERERETADEPAKRPVDSQLISERLSHLENKSAEAFTLRERELSLEKDELFRDKER